MKKGEIEMTIVTAILAMVLKPLAAVLGALFLVEIIKFQEKMHKDQKVFAWISMLLMLVFVADIPVPLWARLAMVGIPFVLNLLDIKHLGNDRGYVNVNFVETIWALFLMSIIVFLWLA